VPARALGIRAGELDVDRCVAAVVDRQLERALTTAALRQRVDLHRSIGEATDGDDTLLDRRARRILTGHALDTERRGPRWSVGGSWRPELDRDGSLGTGEQRQHLRLGVDPRRPGTETFEGELIDDGTVVT